MRGKITFVIDLEDIAPEEWNWLADTVALENTIRDRLNEVPTVTVHEITSLEVVPN